jgi:hypothetical protein
MGHRQPQIQVRPVSSVPLFGPEPAIRVAQRLYVQGKIDVDLMERHIHGILFHGAPVFGSGSAEIERALRPHVGGPPAATTGRDGRRARVNEPTC